jgi:serine/threonine-protein kinase
MAVVLQSGAVIAGRYRLLARLGEGGMGDVWSATNTLTGRTLALKFVRAALAGKADVRKRFLREARTATLVEHPNVVRVHDVFDLEDGRPVMVMDLLKGESLLDLLAREDKIPLARAADILVQVISAVGTAHALGVVHRDLKPDNVFLTGDKVTVLDFGIAKLVTPLPGTEAITQTGSLLGTPAYMSPEQATGERHIDGRTDVWAIGAMLYEMLSGTLPYPGENLGQLVKSMMTEEMVPLDAWVPDVPADVLALVGRMLAREVDRREPDLRDALSVLQRYTTREVHGFGPPGSRVGGAIADEDTLRPTPLPIGIDPSGPTVDATTGPEVITKPSLRPPAPPAAKRVVPLAIGVCALAALGVVGVASLRKPQPPTTAATSAASEAPAQPAATRSATARAEEAPTAPTPLLPPTPTTPTTASAPPPASGSAPAAPIASASHAPSATKLVTNATAAAPTNAIARATTTTAAPTTATTTVTTAAAQPTLRALVAEPTASPSTGLAKKAPF